MYSLYEAKPHSIVCSSRGTHIPEGKLVGKITFQNSAVGLALLART